MEGEVRTEWWELQLKGKKGQIMKGLGGHATESQTIMGS